MSTLLCIPLLRGKDVPTPSSPPVLPMLCRNSWLRIPHVLCLGEYRFFQLPAGKDSTWCWGVAVGSAVISAQRSLSTVKRTHTVLRFFWSQILYFKSLIDLIQLMFPHLHQYCTKMFYSFCVLCSHSHFCHKSCSHTVCFAEFGLYKHSHSQLIYKIETKCMRRTRIIWHYCSICKRFICFSEN